MTAGLAQRGVDDVGIGLGVLGVVAGRRDVNQRTEVATREQVVELGLLRRAGDDDARAAGAHRFEQLARTAGRLDGGQFALLEDLESPAQDGLARLGLVGGAGHQRRKHLVAAHADQRAHPLEGDGITAFGQRGDPSARVRVVGVDQRPVDVEEHRKRHRPGCTRKRTAYDPRVWASMASSQRGPDPEVNSDRGTGTTPPESGPESNSVVGRPAVERPVTAFHEPNEREGEEREPVNEREALEEGGSFDALDPSGNTAKR